VIEVIVIGAGVIGSSVAYRLAQAGAQVTIFETHRVCGGTSATSFAWVNSNNKPPRAYHDLNVAGIRTHMALVEEFGSTPWWHNGGSIEWEADEDAWRAQREKVERLRTWGYAVEWISPRQLHDMEPDVELSVVGGAPIAYYPDEGWLDPVPYAHAMLEAAARFGATLHLGVRVVDVRVYGGRATGVQVEGGGIYGADVVVNCAGRWANDVIKTRELHIPLAPTVGILVCTPPMPTCLRRIVRTPYCDVRPDGGGRLMLHQREIDNTVRADVEPSLELPQAAELVRRAARILPNVGTDRPESVRIGVRPIPADGYSAVGPVPGISGYYVVITHSGVTLSPFLGHVAAEEIVKGRIVPQLEPFRPGRFFPSP
jgi:glycine/D-amino acid oxidase-like deaminating enzyme